MGEIENNLQRFTGTSCYYKGSLGLKYTDGIKYLAESCRAFWLLDVIASHQGERVKGGGRLADEAFQLWTLTVHPEGKRPIGTVDGIKAPVMATAEAWSDTPSKDGSRLLARQHIPVTDFPLESVKLYLTNGVLYLPSEN
jgi:hypothetical protein